MKKRNANPAFTGIKPSFRSHGVEDAGIEGTISNNDSFNNIIKSFNNIQKEDLKHSKNVKADTEKLSMKFIAPSNTSQVGIKMK